MNLATKLAITAGVVALAYVGWLQLDPGSDTRPEGSRRSEGSDLVLASEPETPAPEPPALQPVREAAAPTERTTLPDDHEPGPAVARPETPQEATLEPALLTATFVDESGSPLEGVALSIRKDRWETGDGPLGRSDGAGHAEVAVKIVFERRMSFLAQWRGAAVASGIQDVRLGSGEVRSLGTIVLQPGASVAGRVVTASGQPLEGVRVWSAGPWFGDNDFTVEGEEPDERAQGILQRNGSGGLFKKPEWPAVATTGAEGTYTLEGVVAEEPCRIWAWKPGWRHGWSPQVTLESAGQRTGFDLVLEPLTQGDRIAGIVVGPYGNPVPDAELKYQLHDRGLTLSTNKDVDEQGRFELVLLRAVPHQLMASVSDNRFSSIHLADIQPGSVNLVLQLGEEGTGVRLRVTDPAGFPLENFTVRLEQTNETNSFASHLGGSNHPGGVLWLQPPAVRFKLEIEAQEFVSKTVGPFEDGVVPGNEILVALEPLPGLQGQVFAGGQPQAGATVRLQSVVSDDRQLTLNGFASRLSRASEQATTDADGRFELFPTEPGDFVLSASLEGWGSFESEPFAVDPDAPQPLERLDLPRPGSLLIRVESPDGLPRPGAIVALHRYDSYPRTFVTDGAGEVLVEGLSPGGWCVDLVEEELHQGHTNSSSSGRQPGDYPTWTYDVQVSEGRRTKHRLEGESATPPSTGDR